MKLRVSKAMRTAINSMSALGWAIDHINYGWVDQLTKSISHIDFAVPCSREWAYAWSDESEVEDQRSNIGSMKRWLGNYDGEDQYIDVYMRLMFRVIDQKEGEIRALEMLNCSEDMTDVTCAVCSRHPVIAEYKEFAQLMAAIESWSECEDVNGRLWGEAARSEKASEAIDAIVSECANRVEAERAASKEADEMALFKRVMADYINDETDLEVEVVE